MKTRLRREQFALWFAMNEGWESGLVIGGVSLVFGAAMLAITVPVGPDSKEAGTIEAFGLQETEMGTRGRVVVQTDRGRQVTIRAPNPHRCRVGDRIVVVNKPKIWGNASSLQRSGCAA